MVRTIEAGKTEGGEVEVVWDGLDEDGNRVDAGNYSFEVTAKDADGESVDARRGCADASRASPSTTASRCWCSTERPRSRSARSSRSTSS